MSLRVLFLWTSFFQLFPLSSPSLLLSFEMAATRYEPVSGWSGLSSEETPFIQTMARHGVQDTTTKDILKHLLEIDARIARFLPVDDTALLVQQSKQEEAPIDGYDNDFELALQHRSVGLFCSANLIMLALHDEVENKFFHIPDLDTNAAELYYSLLGICVAAGHLRKEVLRQKADGTRSYTFAIMPLKNIAAQLKMFSSQSLAHQKDPPLPTREPGGKRKRGEGELSQGAPKAGNVLKTKSKVRKLA